MKLISMTDFVLEQNKEVKSQTEQSRAFYHCCNYANFLKQPLELWMFVPCEFVDGVWVVLEEPDRDNNKYDIYDREFCYFNDGLFYDDEQEYQQAKERCLFEGFRVDYFDLGGAEITSKSSFQIISNDNKVQICFYKAKPDYFVWNYKTIEDLVRYNLELTLTTQKQLEL